MKVAPDSLNPTRDPVDNTQVTLRVVVADDDDGLRDLIVLNLEAEGLTVHAAANGGEALQAIVRERPDLVVLDVMMPVHDGLGVLRALKNGPLTATIPVVLLTARAGASDIEEGWAAGADYYLTKPFHMDQLLAFVHELEAIAPTG
jgi:DNA-binding response OmpR family regulator